MGGKIRGAVGGGNASKRGGSSGGERNMRKKLAGERMGGKWEKGESVGPKWGISGQQKWLAEGFDSQF